MHLNFLAPIWFEVMVGALLLARDRIDHWRDRPGRADPFRRRGPVEIAILMVGGIGVVALLRAEELAVAAAVLVLLVLADTAWTHRRPADAPERSV